jgi:hypothetical protein
MAMVLAETRRIVKTTAPQMLSRRNFTFPRFDTKLRKKARSVSVLVCRSELWNISSISRAILGTDSGESPSNEKLPTEPRRDSGRDSSKN